jgi:hypothetical protein
MLQSNRTLHSGAEMACGRLRPQKEASRCPACAYVRPGRPRTVQQKPAPPLRGVRNTATHNAGRASSRHPITGNGRVWQVKRRFPFKATANRTILHVASAGIKTLFFRSPKKTVDYALPSPDSVGYHGPHLGRLRLDDPNSVTKAPGAVE